MKADALAPKRLPAVQMLDLGGRVPPNQPEAENAILSAILTDGRKLEVAQSAGLRADDFYSDANRRIFTVSAELAAKGGAVDVQTVAFGLREREWLAGVGGVSALANILDSTPAIAHVEDYAKIVSKLARRRRAIEIMQTGAARGFDLTCDTDAFLDSAQQDMMQLATENTRGGRAEQVYDATRTVVARSIAQSFGERTIALRTGIREVDDLIGGFERKKLYIMGARPSMGKTALMTTLAGNIAGTVHDGYEIGVLPFSLESSKEELVSRMIAARGEVDVVAFCKGKRTDEAETRLVGAANTISQLPIWIDDTPNRTILEIRSEIRRVQSLFYRAPVMSEDGATVVTPGRRLGLVMIDFLQEMRPVVPGRSREEELTAIASGVKTTAKDLDVPILAFAQLNRAVEGRTDKKPGLADLRESGGIEQAGDVIGFLYRAYYYAKEKQSPEAEKLRRAGEIIFAKVRDGATGSAFCRYIEEHTRWASR